MNTHLINTMTGNQTKIIGSSKVNFDNWMDWRKTRARIPNNTKAHQAAKACCEELGLVLNKDYIARYGEVRFASKDGLAYFVLNWNY
jgi:hypothetical protein